MCIIVAKPSNVTLSRSVWEHCFSENEDGAGIVYPSDGKLIIKKGYFSFDELYDEEIEPNQDKEMIVHFRVASPGMPINVGQCHPFIANSSPNFMIKKTGKPRYLFAITHNGKLDWRHTTKDSDTACFTREALVPWFSRDPFALEYDPGIWLLENAINNKGLNKMAIMRFDVELNESSTYIINRKAGIEEHGCWFSNDTFKYPRAGKTNAYGSDYDMTAYMEGSEWSQALYRNIHPGFHVNITTLREADEALAALDKTLGLIRISKTAPHSQIDIYTRPDENGWVWSYTDDQWENIETKVKAPTLVHRATRPMYMDKLEKVLNRKVIVQRKRDMIARRLAKAYPTVTASPVVPRAPDVSLRHLSKSDKRHFKKMAVDLWEAFYENDCQMDAAIVGLREAVQQEFPDVDPFTEQQLDQWIVQRKGWILEQLVTSADVCPSDGARDQSEANEQSLRELELERAEQAWEAEHGIHISVKHDEAPPKLVTKQDAKVVAFTLVGGDNPPLHGPDSRMPIDGD